VLVTNPSVITAQYMSIANYGAFASDKYMRQALKGLTPKQIKFTLENSDVAWDRYHMAHTNVALGDANKSDQTMRFFTQKSSLLNKLSIGLRSADIAALSGGMAIAQAEYADAQEGAVEGLSAEYWADRNTSFEKDSPDAQREITRRAEYLWEMSQPSWNKWARSELTSNPATKMFFPFRSFHEKSLTAIHRANLDYNRSDKSAGDKGRLIKKMSYITSGYMANYMLKAIILAALYGKLKEPHEYITGVAMSPTGMFPIAGRLLTETSHKFVDILVDESPGYRGEPIESMAVEMLNNTMDAVPFTSNAIAYWLKGDSEKAERDMKKAIMKLYDGAGTMAGVPTDRISRVYEGWIGEEKEFKGKQRGEVKRKH